MERLTNSNAEIKNLQVENEEYWLKVYFKLKEYENLEEQRALIRLPCKIGDTVYEVYQFCGDGAWEIDEHKIKLEDLNKIGKNVFLTMEEAEAALERMNENA